MSRCRYTLRLEALFFARNFGITCLPATPGRAPHGRSGKGQRKLTKLSEIYAFFRQNQTPITFLSPTPYNILGLGRWINKFEYINFFDSFDGTHPKIDGAARARAA